MDILMIGHSGSGKTTYMAGLYAAMSDGVEGYKISTQRYTQEKDLNIIKQNLSKGIYPDGTMVQQQYDFNLSYYGEHSIPFSWYDYRGGALMEKSDSSDDVRQLNNRISSADALIIFLNGDLLVQPVEKNRRQYQRLLWCVNSANNNHNDESNYFPISFVITKGDKYNYDELLNSHGFNHIYNGIWESICNSKTTIGLLTITKITSEVTENVFFPLLFSIQYGLSNYAKHIVSNYNSEYGHIENEYKRKIQNMNIFEKIGEAFTEREYNEAQNKIERKYNILKGNINSLDSNGNRINQLLKEHNENNLKLF